MAQLLAAQAIGFLRFLLDTVRFPAWGDSMPPLLRLPVSNVQNSTV
jgi:hypothetical protein